MARPVGGDKKTPAPKGKPSKPEFSSPWTRDSKGRLVGRVGDIRKAPSSKGGRGGNG